MQIPSPLTTKQTTSSNILITLIERTQNVMCKQRLEINAFVDITPISTNKHDNWPTVSIEDVCGIIEIYSDTRVLIALHLPFPFSSSHLLAQLTQTDKQGPQNELELCRTTATCFSINTSPIFDKPKNIVPQLRLRSLPRTNCR
jgi:hypothetical protein